MWGMYSPWLFEEIGYLSPFENRPKWVNLIKFACKSSTKIAAAI
jgi:hypothetical protein